ncbi:hypothetical protein HK105_204144 [Polyrhizophydium stewartii]|uniref:DUF962-domain-containing protein n=1 Tax=Polyrhizophydium stewartii TaxID=2732419 RepID=A0ABR4NA42_9FUNG
MQHLMSLLANLFNRDYQFVKYAKYHHNKINQIIHVGFVPTILFTAMVWGTNLKTGLTWPLSRVLPVNGALALTSVFGLYYIKLWPTVGSMYMPVLLAMCHYANVFAETKWPIPANALAGVIHVTSWIFQIAGHQIFEGNTPAFLDDPMQALVLAPFFVFCEALFALGLFPKTAASLEAKTVAAIAADKAAAAKKGH